MEDKDNAKLLEIIHEAEANGTKGSYRSYEYYKLRIYNLGLSYADTTMALSKLIEILKV